jgi:flagellar basal body-associated protein FliL
MHCVGRIFVRLSSDNRRQLDRLRRHSSVSRDRLVNTIVRDFFETLHTAAEPRLPRRRAA